MGGLFEVVQFYGIPVGGGVARGGEKNRKDCFRCVLTLDGSFERAQNGLTTEIKLALV